MAGLDDYPLQNEKKRRKADVALLILCISIAENGRVEMFKNRKK